jgi:type I restriction enzyme S subunit
MHEDWAWLTVQQLQEDGVLLVEDGNHGEYRPRPDEFVDDGVAKFIRAADMAAGRILFDEAKSISGVARERIRKGIGRPGDIVFSHKGTVGKLAVAPADAEPFVCSPQTTFWRCLDPTRLDPQFLYTFMRSPLFMQQWHVRKGETDMADYVSLTAQRRLKVPVPDFAEQLRIGGAIRAFDGLIANNRRRIEISEEMARLIYREWFVHLRFPGHEHVEFVDSERGPIPDDWAVRPLSSVLELLYGKALKADDRRGGDVAVYGSGGIVGWHDEALVTGPGIVVGRKGNVGAVYWSDVDFYPIDTTYFVKTRLPLSYVHHQLQTLKFIDSHAAVPGLSRDQAYGLKVLVPTDELLDRFDGAVAHMYALRRNLLRQNEVLQKARDLLLPRLIAGGLDVSDLELDLEPVT